ncbi:GFA family protein [Stappia taiwanensis]|uniref:GFA family protein n=1 Tax=Stappia taiwanensis TaxID=992267 RepID=A0A838XXS1_9HYPH|nr:GFA family protein [Stappia taiwanensis]MBA4613256.1 GFA family protein [Stappia taiwanensis]GGE80634.1 aldehyde-activating protein [Stappia taiwanensis]
MADERLQGGCLCGAVRFAAEPTAREMAVCHCSMCRRWSGGAFMAVECHGVDFEDPAALGVYGSSEYGERVFCKSCGSSLMWRMRDGSHITVAAPAFDDPSSFAFTTEIFIDEKPDAYSFANSTQKLTGAEVFALFAPNQDPQHG